MKRWKELADIIGKQIKIDVVGKTHIGEVMDVDNDGGVNTERRSGGATKDFFRRCNPGKTTFCEVIKKEGVTV